MYNKKTLTFTFHHYWGAFCQGAFVLDPYILYKVKPVLRCTSILPFIYRFDCRIKNPYNAEILLS